MMLSGTNSPPAMVSIQWQ